MEVEEHESTRMKVGGRVRLTVEAKRIEEEEPRQKLTCMKAEG